MSVPPPGSVEDMNGNFLNSDTDYNMGYWSASTQAVQVGTGADLVASGIPSWLGTFATSFVTNFPKTTWNSLTSGNGCINLFFNTAKGDLTPSGAPTPSDVAKTLAAGAPNVAQTLAMAYAASQPNYLGGIGLLYPFKSGMVRAILAGGESVAVNAPLIAADVALFHGLVAEIASAVNGGCQ